MLGVTHILLGAAAGVPVAALTNDPVLIGVAIFGALIPDLDASEATLKHWKLKLGEGKKGLTIKPFYLVSEFIRLFLPHRGWLHSLWAALLVSLVATVGGWGFGLAIFAGYLSHLLADSVTPTGVPLINKNSWHLVPARWRLPTGSQWEHLIGAIAGLIVLSYFVV